MDESMIEFFELMIGLIFYQLEGNEIKTHPIRVESSQVKSKLEKKGRKSVEAIRHLRECNIH